MRRLDARRLEAVLASLAPAGAPVKEGAGVDTLLQEIESAASEAGARAARAEVSNQQLMAGLDTLSIGVVICDEQGDEVYRNVSATTLGRARMGDVLADRAVLETLERAVAGTASERELELFSPVRRNVNVRAFPISVPEGPLGAVAVVEDVSERMRIDAIRRDFVANVSHELKTPVGALSLLAETLDGEDDPAVVARLSARVATEAERLGRIIDDLLDLSRIEANERPDYRSVALQVILGDATELLRPVAEGRNIKLDVDGPPPHLSLPGDRRDLTSAVSNLIDNAIKYSEPGSRVEVRAVAGADTVAISVCDQGIGIPTRDLSRIFERFYRVDRARSRLTGGTGLGLSIVRHVAANHGGTVWVTSREGEGSTFTLELPVRAGSELDPAPAGSRRPAEPGRVAEAGRRGTSGRPVGSGRPADPKETTDA